MLTQKVAPQLGTPIKVRQIIRYEPGGLLARTVSRAPRPADTNPESSSSNGTPNRVPCDGLITPPFCRTQSRCSWTVAGRSIRSEFAIRRGHRRQNSRCVTPLALITGKANDVVSGKSHDASGQHTRPPAGT